MKEIVVNDEDVRLIYRMVEESKDERLKCRINKEICRVFGEDILRSRGVTERVKTFEDACKELGENHPLVAQCKRIIGHLPYGEKVSDVADLEAYLKLRVICAALNESWEPTFASNEHRYTPWFDIHADWFQKKSKAGEKPTVMLLDGYRVEGTTATQADSSCVRSTVGMNLSHRLCLRTPELATYCGDQFISLWMDLCLPKDGKITSNNRDRGEIGIEAI